MSLGGQFIGVLVHHIRFIEEFFMRLFRMAKKHGDPRWTMEYRCKILPV